MLQNETKHFLLKADSNSVLNHAVAEQEQQQIMLQLHEKFFYKILFSVTSNLLMAAICWVDIFLIIFLPETSRANQNKREYKEMCTHTCAEHRLGGKRLCLIRKIVLDAVKYFFFSFFFSF